MIDPQNTFRRFEGDDYPLEDGGAEFNRRLGLVLSGIAIGCAIGLISMAIFVTH
jgi:hypothetical protein